MSPSAKDNAPTWVHALAGQLAGMVGLSVVHPIDTVKIRVQANGGRAMSTASSLVKRDGPLALYRGIGAPMVAYGLINAVAFSTNTAVVRTLREGFDAADAPLLTDPWLVGLAGGVRPGSPARSFAAPRRGSKPCSKSRSAAVARARRARQVPGHAAHGGDAGERARRVPRVVHGHGGDRRQRGAAVRGVFFDVRRDPPRVRPRRGAGVSDRRHSVGGRFRRRRAVGGDVPPGRGEIENPGVPAGHVPKHVGLRAAERRGGGAAGVLPRHRNGAFARVPAARLDIPHLRDHIHSLLAELREGRRRGAAVEGNGVDTRRASGPRRDAP